MCQHHHLHWPPPASTRRRQLAAASYVDNEVSSMDLGLTNGLVQRGGEASGAAPRLDAADTGAITRQMFGPAHLDDALNDFDHAVNHKVDGLLDPTGRLASLLSSIH